MDIKIGLSKYRYFMSFLAKIFGKKFGNKVLFCGFIYDFPDKNRVKQMEKYLDKWQLNKPTNNPSTKNNI